MKKFILRTMFCLMLVMSSLAFISCVDEEPTPPELPDIETYEFTGNDIVTKSDEEGTPDDDGPKPGELPDLETY